MGRAPCCDKANVKKGPWSPEEDAKLKSYIEQHGTGGNWIALPQKIGLKRCGKSCRLRWLNYLRPNIKHGGFSEEEDRIICGLYASIGSRWSIIAAQLPGRTDNDIKNYWNTRLKKKLLGKQRKDQNYSSTSGRKSKRLILSDHHQLNINTINPGGLIPHDNNNPTNFNTQVMFPYTCWPPIPATGPELPGGLLSEDQSMRSLLVKLEHQQQEPAVYYEQDGLVNLHPPFITNGHDQLVNMSNVDQGHQLITSHSTHPITTSFPRELEELMSSSINHQRMDGPDQFLAWEDHTSCGESMGTTSWCEMSSLISLPIPNNASCQGFLPQDDHQLSYTAGN